MKQVEFNPPISPVNKQPRCPVVLLLDTSTSMRGEPIDRLNEAMVLLPTELRGDSLALKRIEIAIVTFGPVRTKTPFTIAGDFRPPALVASGHTPLGAAVKHTLRMVEDRKNEYRAQHLEYFRPLVFLFTDGAPDEGDDWVGAAAMARQAEADKRAAMFPIGVQGADMEVLTHFSSRKRPAQLKELRFREFFVWLSNTLGDVANSGAHSGGSGPPPAGRPTGDWGDLY